jgi:putative inorganic carbon (HCO3(-)) transporter
VISKKEKTPVLLSNPWEQIDSSGSPSPSPSVPLLLLAGLLVPGILTYALIIADEAKVMAGVIAILFVIAIIYKPFLGLLCFIGLLYARPEEAFPALAGLRLPLIMALVTLVATWLQFSLHRHPLTRTPINPLILVFGAIALLTTFQNGTLSTAGQDIAKIVILVLLILNLVRTRERYQKLVTAIIVCSSYLALYSIYLFLTGHSLLREGTIEQSVATGIFSDPNDLSATIVAGLALALHRIVIKKKYLKLLYVLLVGAMTWAVLLTSSRGGLLAFLTALGGIFLIHSRRKGLAIFLAACVCGTLFLLAPGRMGDMDSKEESANSRLGYWQNGINQLFAYPLQGIGYGQFPSVNGGYTAHNTFVLCFAEIGSFGYFCWMGFIYYGFKKDRSTEERPDRSIASGTAEKILPVLEDLPGSRLALASYLVACFWISRTYALPTYVLLGLPAVGRLIVLEKQSRQESSMDRLSKDWGKICVICVLSVLFIQVMVRVLY